MAAQKLSIKFATRIRRIMAYNIEEKKATKGRLSGAVSDMELNDDISTKGSYVLFLFSLYQLLSFVSLISYLPQPLVFSTSPYFYFLSLFSC